MDNKHVIRTNRFGDFSTFFGRFLIGAVFLMAGIIKIMTFSAVKSQLVEIGFFWATFFVIATIALEIIGGFALIVGYHTKIVAGVLAVFVIILTPIMHNPIYADQMILFTKNLMIIGGLLFVSAFGAGRISIDHKILKDY